MKKLERSVEVAHTAALAVWLAGLVAAGLAAAVAFPVMKELDPRLPDYSAYGGEHWMIAAGHIGRRVFSIADRVQLVCSAVAVLTLAAATRGGWVSGLWLALRWAPLAVAAGLGVYNGLVLAPRMDEKLVAYWSAAKSGEEARAAELKGDFAADHPTASRVISIAAGGVFLSMIAAAASRGAAAAR